MSTTINHGQMAQIDENGNVNVFYPKTFSDDVYVDNNGTSLTSKLSSMDTAIGGKTNTAVKGNAESSYRTGNVNITPANIGLGNVDNTADANKSVNYANSAGTATYAQNATGNLANTLNGKVGFSWTPIGSGWANQPIGLGSWQETYTLVYVADSVEDVLALYMPRSIFERPKSGAFMDIVITGKSHWGELRFTTNTITLIGQSAGGTTLHVFCR